MKICQLICSSLFVYIYATCAMQQYNIPAPLARNHAPSHHHHNPEVIVIEMPAAQPAVDSPHTREVAYNRKKKLALIGLFTAALAGGTAVVVFLTK